MDGRMNRRTDGCNAVKTDGWRERERQREKQRDRKTDTRTKREREREGVEIKAYRRKVRNIEENQNKGKIIAETLLCTANSVIDFRLYHNNIIFSQYLSAIYP